MLIMPANLRIHIVPIGFEYRRVTQPLINMQADRVYLIKYKKNDNAAKFYNLVEEELRQKYRHIQTRDVLLDMWNLYACITEFRKIILQESGNHVYVNVSTGTKITAIAGMLACMLWNAQPYYAPVSYETRAQAPVISEHVSESEILPTYGINKPKLEFMQILGLLDRYGGTMKKHQIIKELEDAGMIQAAGDNDDLSAPAKHSKLRSLLDPMVREWSLISVKSSGSKSEVSIEPQGETALKIFGAVVDSNR